MSRQNKVIDLSQTELIKQEALAVGFDVVGITSSTLPKNIGSGLFDYIEAGHHASMAWIEDRAAKRASPDVLWPEAKSVIMLGLNYGPDHDPMEKLKRTDEANISVYAQDRDYHDLIKKRLKRVGRWIGATFDCGIKVFVDTAPVMEKPLAAQAGLGWQGKHTNLVSREMGSWLFLGAIFTTLDLETDEAEIDHCGSCQSCLDICPTKAFPAPYKIDAGRCISYLTIEHKGSIPLEFRKPMGNRIYGCDDCLAVCPWNKFAQATQETAFHTRDALKAPLLKELVMLDDAAFREMFRQSPVKRIGRNRLIRNVLIAIGNSGDPSLLSYTQRLQQDDDPVIQEMAAWAAAQLEAL